MKLKDLRLHRWPLALTLGLSLTFFSCATTSQVKVTAEVIDPAQAGSRSVMVVPDSFMSDAAEADTVAELVRASLLSLGFKINDTEEKAELIVIPTLERSTTQATSRVPTQNAASVRYFPRDGTNQPDGIPNAMRKLGFELRTLPEQEQPRIGLMVTAISKDVWLNAPLASESEIPRVWRVVAIAPLTKEDMTAKLVEAAGAKLGEIAAAPSTPAPPTPTPSPTPKKEP